MKSFDWNPEKNRKLIEERGCSFEDAAFYILNGGLLADVPHSRPEKYPNQRIFVVDVAGYVYLVPYVESDDYFFLKTVIPSRKATKEYLGESNE